jgi:riboflavin kinase/FMN adenylyltransferase
LAVVAPQRAPKLLTTVERRAELVAGLGVEELVVAPMDRAFATLGAAAFVEDVLVGALGATHVSVGANFRFGRGAEGDTDMLAADGRFATRVVPLLEMDGDVVCSSRIRALLAAGRLEDAEALLGAPFAVAAEVTRLDRAAVRGYLVAQATIAEGHLLPAAGRYACCATAAGRHHAAVANVADGVVEVMLRDMGGDGPRGTLRLDFLGTLSPGTGPPARPERVARVLPRAAHAAVGA